MEDQLCIYKLLHSCTMRLSIPGVVGLGTGFFVAPGVIITCFHVVKDALNKAGSVSVFWSDQNLNLLAKITDFRSDLDLALLELNLKNHPCVYLSEEFKPGDSLYCYGYPHRYQNGDSATFRCEGWTANKSYGQPDQMKLKAGEVKRGLSGAPLLNKRTWQVCGLVVTTRGEESELGGRAIMTTTVFQEFPHLRDKQQQFHQVDRSWIDCLDDMNPATKVLREALQQARAALQRSDYTSAKRSLDNAVDVLQEDKQPKEAAKTKYLQALVRLNGRRPLSQTLPPMKEAENFMNSALQLHSTASYLLTLALFKYDFAAKGRPQLKNEAYGLILQAMQMDAWTSEDNENIMLLEVCQPDLVNKYANLIRQVSR